MKREGSYAARDRLRKVLREGLAVRVDEEGTPRVAAVERHVEAAARIAVRGEIRFSGRDDQCGAIARIYGHRADIVAEIQIPLDLPRLAAVEAAPDAAPGRARVQRLRLLRVRHQAGDPSRDVPRSHRLPEVFGLPHLRQTLPGEFQLGGR